MLDEGGVHDATVLSLLGVLTLNVLVNEDVTKEQTHKTQRNTTMLSITT